MSDHITTKNITMTQRKAHITTYLNKEELRDENDSKLFSCVRWEGRIT